MTPEEKDSYDGIHRYLNQHEIEAFMGMPLGYLNKISPLGLHKAKIAMHRMKSGEFGSQDAYYLIKRILEDHNKMHGTEIREQTFLEQLANI